MIAEDRRIVAAVDADTGQTVWSRDWEDIGYRTAEWLSLPTGAWLKFSLRGGLTTGMIALAAYLAHGLEEEEEERHGRDS